MAAEYFIYTTSYDNTLTGRSNSSFAPLPPNTGEIYIDYFIPEIQPLYYYRETGATIVHNDEETINDYLKGTAPPPEPDDNVLQYTFTGYTGTTDTRLNGIDEVISGNTTGVTANTAAINVSNELIVINYDLITGNTTDITNNLNDINYISGVTDTKHNISDFNSFTGTTLPTNYYNKVEINSYTGTTATIIGTKLNTSDFNTYSGTTDIRLGDIDSDIGYISGVTDTKHNTSDFNSFTGTTLPAGYYNKTQIDVYTGDTLADINTRVYRSGDTMTGSLSTSGNLTAVGVVTGSSVSASVLMTTPVLNASTSICAPRITGSTCITTPISCATTRMQAPVVCGGTCAVSPITIGSSCLCSQGTTGLDGGVTAASFLNVSGVTTLNSNICWSNPNTGGTLNDYGVKWDPISKELRTIATTGSSANVYCYSQRIVLGNNSTTTNATYLTETWNVPSGYYEFVFNAIYGNNASNRCATVCFLVDGVVAGTCNLMKTNSSAVRTTAYVTQNTTLVSGNHTMSIAYRQQGGGTATVYYGVMRLQKIAES